MSTADKLNKVLETKQAIKQAIIDKGGTVGDVFAEYPTAIQNIQGGGGSGTFVVPAGMKFAYSAIKEFPEDWDWSESENVEDASHMFYECSALTKLPDLNFKNITKLSHTFEGCEKLVEINTSQWSTSNVTDMTSTFDTCRNLKTLDISNLDLSKVSSLYGTFNYCSSLRTIGTFDTSNCSNFRDLFCHCENINNIPEIDASANTSTYSSYNSPIQHCYALRNFGGFKGMNKSWFIDSAYSLSYESLLNIINGLADGVSGQTLKLNQDLVNQLTDDDIAIATNKGWSISPARTITTPIVVTDINQIPSSTYTITPRTYDFSQYTGNLFDDGWYYFEGDISSANSYEKYFYSCDKLKYAILKTNIAGSTKSMFDYNTTIVGITGLEGYTTDAANMFTGCHFIETLDLSKLDTSQCTAMSHMFHNCQSLISAPEMDTSNVTDMTGMFGYCYNLKEIPKYNTQSVTSMSSMFSCSGITTVDFRGCDLSNIKYMNLMFQSCEKLTTVMMDSAIHPSVDTNAMFSKVTTEGTFYYNPAYDYSNIIAKLPATWTAVPLTE